MRVPAVEQPVPFITESERNINSIEDALRHMLTWPKPDMCPETENHLVYGRTPNNGVEAYQTLMKLNNIMTVGLIAHELLGVLPPTKQVWGMPAGFAISPEHIKTCHQRVKLIDLPLFELMKGFSQYTPELCLSPAYLWYRAMRLWTEHELRAGFATSQPGIGLMGKRDSFRYVHSPLTQCKKSVRNADVDPRMVASPGAKLRAKNCTSYQDWKAQYESWIGELASETPRVAQIIRQGYVHPLLICVIHPAYPLALEVPEFREEFFEPCLQSVLKGLKLLEKAEEYKIPRLNKNMQLAYSNPRGYSSQRVSRSKKSYGFKS